jgi:ParB family chromosome partitioning protein
LAELLDDETVDGNVRAEAEIKAQEADDAIRAIVDKSPVLDPSLRSQAGLFLMLDELGRARLDTTYYTAILPDADPLGGDGHPSRPEPASGSSAAAGLSQRLVNELAIQRRDILAVHLAGDPALALDLAIFLMVDRGTGAVTERSGFSLSASPPSNPILDFKTPEAAATSARAEADRALDRGWLDGETKSARFDAFRALSDEARAAWLGHAVAATIEASLQLPGDRFCSFHDHLGELLAIDVARWWRPTGANFFDRVPKSVTLAALAEVGGPALAARYIKARKPELAQACERIFSGEFIAELEVKEAALAWLPEVMRFGTKGLSGPDQPSEAGAQTTGTQPLPEPSPLGTPAPAELEVAA